MRNARNATEPDRWVFRPAKFRPDGGEMVLYLDGRATAIIEVERYRIPEIRQEALEAAFPRAHQNATLRRAMAALPAIVPAS
jgi:hypothetical protein